MQYQVAVIIPTLNEERFIAQVLDSVICQSYPFGQMDVMVVDGGSTDSTRDIVTKYASKYNNIRLLDNPGRIQSIAFNIGGKSSSAPFVMRLDAHAYYDKYYVENILNLYHGKDKELINIELIGNIGGRCSILSQYSRLIAETSAILNQVKFGIGGAAFRVGAERGFVDTVPFGCFPRRVIDQIGGMREDLPRGEDNEYNSRIRKAGYKVLFSPEIKCSYYSRDTIKGNLKQMFANGISIAKLMFIDSSAIGLRHLIPLFFVISLLLSLLWGILYPDLWSIALFIPTIYLIANISASIIACYHFGAKYIISLPWMFLLVHLSYGYGTIVGMAKLLCGKGFNVKVNR